MHGRLLLLSVPLTLFLPACADPAARGRATGTTRDSAGIVIVENDAPAWTAADAWTISGEPTLETGTAEGDHDHEFYQIAGVTRLWDGTIIVANSGTQQLRYYAPDGALARSVGRKGGGPGEFQMLITLRRIPGDSVLTFDAMNRRMSLFDAASRHVPDLGATDASDPIPLLVQGRPSDGSHVADLTNMRFGPAMFDRKPGPTRDGINVLRLDAGGAPTDTLGLFPGPRSEVQMIEFGGRSMPMPVMTPFSPSNSVATTGDRVYVGVSDTYGIRVYAPAGTPTTLIRRPHEPRSVTPEEAAEYSARLAEVVADQANPLAEQILDAYAKVPFPETMPAYETLMVDAHGNLWVGASRASPDEDRSWSVCDPDGVWLDDVSTPAQFAGAGDRRGLRPRPRHR